MSLAGVELETLVSEPDTLTTRPLPCAVIYLTNCCSMTGPLPRKRKITYLKHFFKFISYNL